MRKVYEKRIKGKKKSFQIVVLKGRLWGGDFTVVAVSLLNGVAMTTVYLSSGNGLYLLLGKCAYM